MYCMHNYSMILTAILNGNTLVDQASQYDISQDLKEYKNSWDDLDYSNTRDKKTDYKSEGQG